MAQTLCSQISAASWVMQEDGTQSLGSSLCVHHSALAVPRGAALESRGSGQRLLRTTHCENSGSCSLSLGPETLTVTFQCHQALSTLPCSGFTISLWARRQNRYWSGSYRAGWGAQGCKGDADRHLCFVCLAVCVCSTYCSPYSEVSLRTGDGHLETTWGQGIYEVAGFQVEMLLCL